MLFYQPQKKLCVNYQEGFEGRLMEPSELKARVKSGGKVNPKLLKKGLKVTIIRGRNKDKTGIVTFWHDPTDEDPGYQIDVKTGSEMSYLGLSDIRHK